MRAPDLSRGPRCRPSCMPPPPESPMRSTTLRCAAAVASLVLLAPASVPAQSNREPASDSLAAANLAWDRGDYITALQAYARLLSSPNAAQHLESIALTTGELYQTVEITADGRAP